MSAAAAVLRAALAGALILAIQAYRLVVSPLLGPSCRYAPSCSQYGIEAIRTHGPARGVWLALRRVSRCHPFHEGGYDPVPPPAPCFPEGRGFARGARPGGIRGS